MTGAEPAAISFRDGEGGRIALVTITLPGEQPLPSAHRHAGAIEEAVREQCPTLGDVIVHTEPAEAGGGGGRGPGCAASAYSRLTAAAAPTASSTPE